MNHVEASETPVTFQEFRVNNVIRASIQYVCLIYIVKKQILNCIFKAFNTRSRNLSL